MRRAIRVPEPPLVPTLPDEHEDENDDDFGELLPGLGEETVDDADDDAQVPGVSEEFDIDPPLDDVTFDDQTSPDLRFGKDSVLPEENDDDASDDAGFAAERPTGQTEPEDALPPDDDEPDGLDEARPFVNELDLPSLDADEEGVDGDAARFGGLLAASELAWPSAVEPWRVTRLSPERERCSALAIGRGAIVAGSTDLLWLDAGRSAPVRLALDGTRILALALVGEGEDTIVAVTATGRLLRRARLASDSERVGELNRALERGQRATRVDLCALGAPEPRALLRRSELGPLERSDDAGSSFFPLEPRLFASTLATSRAPVAALVDAGRELALSTDGGRHFERRRLDGAAAGVALGDAPLLGATDGVVAIVDSERGLVVSTDEGRRFREVPGCASATACAVGVQDGRAFVWLSLYSEAADLTRILLVDPERAEAEVIAKIQGSGDDEELGASARVEALGWDGTRLFAVGEPGFLLLEPPSEPRH
ncbi:MAG TPA: hypothetical protein VMI54_15915 [Polyangiaceae bacterium]|nr:hypothetical protein [Polyangiaceae bacterium]